MKLLLFALTFCITTPLLAQLDSLSNPNSLQLMVGFNQVKEENLHPKVHRGLLYGVQFTHDNLRRNSSSFRLAFLYSPVQTTLENAPTSTYIQLNWSYSYRFKLFQHKTYKWYLGPIIATHYRLSYYPVWDDSHLYWADDCSIGVSNRFQYQLNPTSSVLLQFHVSLLSLFSRPIRNRAYKIDDVSLGGIIGNMHSNLEWGLLNKAFNLSLQAEYQFRLSKRMLQAVFYTLEYGRFKANEGLPFSNLQHQLGLKLYF